MDFSIHCDLQNNNNMVMNGVQCPNIQNAIRICRQNKKRVLIGIGGSNAVEEFTRFTSQVQAEQLANNIWNLFLGGASNGVLRPFGKYVHLSHGNFKVV